MKEKKPEAVTASGGIAAPNLPENASFSASRRELLAALALYPLAYLYVNVLPYGTLELALFVLSFVGLTELLHWRQPRARESWLWLGCMVLLLISLLLRGSDDPRPEAHVWPVADTYFFLHIFAVWYVLCRSGCLLEGQSGTLLPLDAFNGFVRIPFRHFFLRLRCLWYRLTHLQRDRGSRPVNAVWTILAILAALLLLVRSASLLADADAGFDALLGGLLRWVKPDALLFLSLPVGAYLFGLLAGTAREDPQALRRRGEAVRTAINGLRRVSPRLWTGLLALFCLLYLLFFAVQGRYLFGAFVRQMPEGFVVSTYARRGFFELCQVMAVNFLLLWLAARTTLQPVETNRPLRLLCVLLLLESMLFAVVAGSKLWLYIDCFGFTPRRLQSCWLAATLLIGCVCSLYSLLSGRHSFRAWMAFGGVTLSLLALY